MSNYKYMKNLLFIISCLLFTLICHAQYKEGIKYYEGYQYNKAIPYLKKAANKNNAHRTDAAIKLADCYRNIKDYKNAETYYKQALEQDNSDMLAHYNYATVLKNNNKYDEALKEFSVYLRSNPDDIRVKNAIKSFQDIKVWQSLPKEYEVANLSEINTEKSEFSPGYLRQ